ncbi:cccp-1 [Pristionchus pacificus]|nr:cccp-1 [Pristionchus pacificus]
MSDGDGSSADSLPSSSTSASPSHVNGEGNTDELPGEEASHTKLHDLYEKYNVREKEISRLEKQNEEYREKLIRAIRERDEFEEKVKLDTKERTAKVEELDRKVVELDCTLKVAKDRANAQELHFNRTTSALTEKFNKQVNDLSRKMEIAEGEKNQSVIKYAMREAELMKLQAEIAKKDETMKGMKKEIDDMKGSASEENLQSLQKANVDLKVEMEKIKHEKFDLDNRYKAEVKRNEASQTTITDLKQQLEMLRRQLIALKEDKTTIQEEHKSLVQRMQAEEERIRSKEESIHSNQSEKEELYKKIVHDAARAKEKNSELSGEIENLLRENTTLMGDLQEAESRIKAESEKNGAMKMRLDQLTGIENKVKGALEAEKVAKKEKEEAELEKANAESEAAECRKQAERMLEITENLTKRNTALLDELAEVRDKASSLQTQLIEEEGARQRIERNVASTEQDIESVRSTLDAEIKELKEKLKEETKKADELARQLDEERTDNNAFRKKANSTIKELKHETSNLRRQNVSLQASTPSDLPSIDISHPSSTLGTGSSRASSTTSIDQLGQKFYREKDDSEKDSSSISMRDKEKDCDSLQSKEDECRASQSLSPPSEEVPIAAQQAMIEKIVKLQKQLLRRKEKIEFLEEHVRQCLDELQKKTKLIQYYALREEASLLLPSDEGMQKLISCCEFVQVPIAKKTSSTYALMGAIFTGGGNSEKKAALQLATEVNSRLQAVLEDTLLKNINLKESVDKLGEEISRLSRENRKLTLASK